MAILFTCLYVIFSLVVVYRAMNALVWEVGSACYLLGITFFIGCSWWVGILLWVGLGSVVLLLRVLPVRYAVIDFIFHRAAKSMPKLSKTEEEALNAGDTWIEKDIFRGTPDWEKLASISTSLTEEEQSFLNHETETLCALLNEWEIGLAYDLPPEVWTYLKDNGFFGLVISKTYGGKGFSARAHSDIVSKIASRSPAAAVTVMVPNSLGPGELLQHYGTDEQKEYYLPRLAKGIDIPCFALTEPEAGSDATSIRSEAVVIEKKIAGKNELGLLLTLEKRWITLSPIATLVGLAVQLKDPDGLLKGVGSEGITCLLIESDVDHLEIGNRHLPAGQPFMNGTIRGSNIFVPINSIIGGQEQAGRGWPMLVECLSIGRSISLPALSAATAAISYVTAGAFSRIRRQFNVDIAQFEGIEEKLAEIAGLNYLTTATRLLTVAAVTFGKKPSVASAITKYFNTELGRKAINAAIDVHGGRTVVLGPRNYLASHYQGLPISITVEGANIMTRNLLIFGQGSMACHPYIRDEFYAISKQDKEAFRQLFWQHISYFVRNVSKTVGCAWTSARWIAVSASSLKREHQQVERLSYAFAFLSDLSLMTLGGDLKRKERLSARLADAMSYLYMAMAALHHCQQNEDHLSHQQHAAWAVSYCCYHAQKAMIDLCHNFPSRFLGIIARWAAFPMGQSMRYPTDQRDHELAALMTQNNPFRDSLIQSIYVGSGEAEPIARMENTLQLILKHEHMFKKFSDLKRLSPKALIEKCAQKVAQGELTQQALDDLITLEKARWDAIQVDEFSFESMKKKVFESVIDLQKTPFD